MVMTTCWSAPPFWDNPQQGEGAAYLYEGSPEVGNRYCLTAINSTGAPGRINALGSPSASAGLLALRADDVPNTPGIFFHGANQIQVPFGNGILCVGGAITRGAITSASGNQAAYVYDNSGPKRRMSGFVGSTRYFQYWFRDNAGGGAGFNTSDGVAVTIAP